MTASAAAVLESLVDPGSFESWDQPIPEPGGDDGYSQQRRTARTDSGCDESVLTCSGRIDDQPVALVVGEFGYLAGSVGHDAADRIITAYERATAERLPLIAAPVSGGTRMQEGTPAFLRMAGIAAAAAAHRSAGLPSLVLLRGPTTGGVLATWGSLGQLAIAEPGALIGFLGPRVYREVVGEPFPAGIQQAEHLVAHGVLDGTGAVDRWREAASRFLRVATGGGASSDAPVPALPALDPVPPQPDPAAWASVQATRDAARPGARELLSLCASDVLQIPGSGAGEAAGGLILALARIHGSGAVVVAQDRAAQVDGRSIGPWSLRAAQRAMRLAAELGLPLLTVIDTPGAELSPAAEEGALAGEIARTLALLAQLPTPTVAALLGQGAGGAAIAMLPCDVVVAASNAWVMPLPPEGAAAIVHRDRGRAPELAAEQRITAGALAEVGAVDTVIPEVEGWVGDFGLALRAALSRSKAAWADDPAAASAARRTRWRSVTR